MKWGQVAGTAGAHKAQRMTHAAEGQGTGTDSTTWTLMRLTKQPRELNPCVTEAKVAALNKQEADCQDVTVCFIRESICDTSPERTQRVIISR